MADTSGKPNQPESIFLAALEIASPAERASYVNAACGGDPTLQSQVEELLAAYPQIGQFLEKPAIESDQTPCRAADEQPSDSIGPYKLLQEIGQGGMGVVYMAEQKTPVERRVAIKIIKPGMDSRQVVSRFEAERQALALMDHPNIAHVLDAGATRSGRPYFVMELVKGLPVTTYCDREHLTVRERLDLFVSICHAVQHAHHKGIIHRDLKPSNVLIGLYDGKPVPKIIDFGVAKAINQQLTEKTLFTQYGQIVGTLEYMSPEQADLNQLDVDTRSDVYSLGVLLYELLAGEPPFDRHRLQSAAFDELLKIIREEEPLRPSIRLSSNEMLPSVAASRRTEPKKLNMLLRGDLDWIVMKSLEKDRARRYQTASGLADDVQRYLGDEPVVACPPSATYRFRKFYRRNKFVFAAATCVGAALIIGAVATTWQAIRATRAERRATAEALQASQQASRANRETDRARTEAAISQAVTDFINEDLLAQADPRNEPERDIKLLAVLQRAAAKVEGRFSREPRVEAAIRMTLAKTFNSLGKYDEAARHFEKALEIRQRELGSAHPDTLSTLSGIAGLKVQHNQYDEAAKIFEQIALERSRVLGQEHADTLEAATNLAQVRIMQGRFAEAEELCMSSLGVMGRALGAEHKVTLRSKSVLATLYCETAQFGKAEKYLTEVLAVRRRTLGNEHPDTFTTLNNLAAVLEHQKRSDEASALFAELIATQTKILGADHPTTLASLLNSAAVEISRGELKNAEKVAVDVVQRARRAWGDDVDVTRNGIRLLAEVLQREKRYEESAKLTDELLSIVRRTLGPENPEALEALGQLGLLYTAQGRYVEAKAVYEQLLHARRKVFGEEHAFTFDVLQNLSSTYGRIGQYDEAANLLKPALEAAQRVFGRDHLRTLDLMSNLGAAYCNLGLDTEAKVLLADGLVIARRVLGSEHRITLACMQNLSVAYRHLERYEESAKLTEEMFDVSRRTLGPDDPRTLDRAISLVQIYRDQQRWGDAEKLVRQVLEARLRTVGPDHPNSLSTIRALGLVFCDQGRFQEAVALYREAVGRLQTKSKIADSRELSRLLNGLASLLASCPDPAVRNATDAVALAAQLVEAAPKDENNWNTLGVAQYYDGQWSAAIESITKSIELEPPGDAWDWLILAMAHWRLGHLDDARSWFARSIDWMATKKAHSRELLQFHAEASELLGVADSSPAASGASESNPGTEPEAEGPSITK